MNDAIELHDSELQAVIPEDGAITLRLNAYIHRSKGRPGIDNGVGGWQTCTFVFAGGTIEGEPGALPADLMTGKLELGDHARMAMISLPLTTVDETVRLELYLDPNYRKIVARGTGLTIRREGDFEPAEEFRVGAETLG